MSENTSQGGRNLLLRVLEQAGIERLYEHRHEISGLCPHHDDTKPCWSINKTTLRHRCFSCGYSGTLQEMLSELTSVSLSRARFPEVHQLLDDLLDCDDTNVASLMAVLLHETARLREAGRN